MMTAGNWQFDFSQPLVAAVSVLVLISLVLTLRAARRRLSHSKPARVLGVVTLNIVSCCVILALLGDPQIEHFMESEVVLLTEGFVAQAGNLPTHDKIYSAPGVDVEVLDQARSNQLLDSAQLIYREPALTKIEVRGFGLNAEQWSGFPDDLQVSFAPPSVTGFTDMNWDRSLSAGAVLQVEGHFGRGITDTIFKLLLLDPAGNRVDETRIKSNSGFSLRARPRSRGNLEYILQSWDGDQLISEQTVPVAVTQAGLLNIMVVQSAPSFETRHLKNYAASLGHHVLVNTTLSKDRTISQLVNLPDNSPTAMSPSLLQSQDLLIMDGRSLAGLDADRRQWLDGALGQGLGLLVLADSSLLEDPANTQSGLLKDFRLTASTRIDGEAAPRLLTDVAAEWREPLTLPAMEMLAIDADVLIDDGLDQPLLARRKVGLGHIAVSLLSHSHEWLTSQGKDIWSSYWSGIIARLGRQKRTSYLLPPDSSEFFSTHQRVPVCVMSMGEHLSVEITPPGANIIPAVFRVELETDLLGSPRQCAFFWPQHSGWHGLRLLRTGNDSVLDQQAIHIFSDDQWRAQKRAERATATRTRSQKVPKSTNTDKKWVSVPIDTFWLWLILVLSSTLLWIERKFHLD